MQAVESSFIAATCQRPRSSSLSVFYERSLDSVKLRMALRNHAFHTFCRKLGATFTLNQLKCLWHLLMSCATLYLIIMTPFLIGFGSTPSHWTPLDSGVVWSLIFSQYAVDALLSMDLVYDCYSMMKIKRRRQFYSQRSERRRLLLRLIGTILPLSDRCAQCWFLSMRQS